MGPEQRSLRETRPHRELLSRLDLEGRLVVDLGAGLVEITDLILERRPLRVIECDESMDREGVEMLARELAAPSLLPENCVVISNPPSDMVEHVLDVLDRSRVRDVVLMVEESCARELVLRGFEIVFRLDTHAFEPPVECPFVVATRCAVRSK